MKYSVDLNKTAEYLLAYDSIYEAAAHMVQELMYEMGLNNNNISGKNRMHLVCEIQDMFDDLNAPTHGKLSGFDIDFDEIVGDKPGFEIRFMTDVEELVENTNWYHSTYKLEFKK